MDSSAVVLSMVLCGSNIGALNSWNTKERNGITEELMVCIIPNKLQLLKRRQQVWVCKTWFYWSLIIFSCKVSCYEMNLIKIITILNSILIFTHLTMQMKICQMMEKNSNMFHKLKVVISFRTREEKWWLYKSFDNKSLFLDQDFA